VRKLMADPTYHNVPGWRVELTPGDILIIPSQWLHYVETIETSLTYSGAWIDGSNWDAYVRQAREVLEESLIPSDADDATGLRRPWRP
jgi:ribosomal protein L16 Arg81 hydroxylase